MAEAIILFNGIKYSFGVVDRAVLWAKQNGGSLYALFLRSKEVVSESYIFPSDLDAAEEWKTTEQASTQHGRVIDSNVQMLEHLLQSENIRFKIEILTDPDSDSLLEKVKVAEILFAPETIAEPGILTADSINLRKWLKHVPVPVELLT